MLFLLFALVLFMTFQYPHFAGRIVFLSLAAYALVVAHVASLVSSSSSSSVSLLCWQGLVRIDAGTLGAMLFLILLVGAIVYRMEDASWEFHLVLLGGLTGAIYLISAYDLLLMVIGFELLNLSTYLLLSLYRGTETATLKYLLSSAFYTSLLLLGVSFMYALTGSTGFDALAMQASLFSSSSSSYGLLVPQLLFLATVTFKLGLVPAHLWLPDVYDGLPMTLLTYMGSLPKAAILLWLPTLGPLLFSSSSSSSSAFISFTSLLLIIGVLSFTLSAILLGGQYKMKRFLAYSAIGHVGFLVTALALGDLHTYGYYLGLYMVATLAQFVLLADVETAVSSSSSSLLLSHTRVLVSHGPLAAGFLVLVFTMASLPPFAGFYAKMLVLFGLLDVGYGAFAVLLILASLRSAAYYLKWVQNTFFVSAAPRDSSSLVVRSPDLLAFLLVLILPTTSLLLA